MTLYKEKKKTCVEHNSGLHTEAHISALHCAHDMYTHMGVFTCRVTFMSPEYVCGVKG